MRHFTPELFKFFRELKANNDREWFEANKHRFEEAVREPMLAFIRDFEEPLRDFAPMFRSEPKKSGGSLFRIHRDVRFSDDKSPYKTNGGIHFRHGRHKDAHAPGFYLHFEPGASFMGVGLWRPQTPVAREIRAAIDCHQEEWKAVFDDGKFTALWKLDRGDSLKRPPQGYSQDHPLIEDLKLKSFAAFSALTQKEICADGFIDEFERRCRASVPLARFLTEATGEQWTPSP